MLVLCGSVSSWIEKNIISNTLFLGRPSLYIKLPELSVADCDEFWGAYRERISAYEKLKVLSITGGIPRYLELINPNKSAEDNIIVELLGVPPEEIVFSNPYFQKMTKTHPGCQIDLLIQTKFNCLYVCEIKFSRSEITASVIDEVKQKISRLNIPKNFSYRPVLIHVNGVNSTVIDSGYFAKIIDFGQLLSEK